MKKLLLTLMLSIASSSAMAEWVYVTETKKEEEKAGAFTAYADPASIRKTGNRVKMWVMYDYYKAMELGIISARHKEEFDCEKKQMRQLFLSAHSVHMADGETVFIRNVRDDWEPVPPYSVGGAVLEFACGWHPKTPPRNFPSETFS
jgi:hypothetical protein